jgi:hypothetical protein
MMVRVATRKLSNVITYLKTEEYKMFYHSITFIFAVRYNSLLQWMVSLHANELEMVQYEPIIVIMFYYCRHNRNNIRLEIFKKMNINTAVFLRHNTTVW